MQQIFRYDPIEGVFYSTLSNRKVKPDTKGVLLVTYKGKRYRFNANKVAIMLIEGSLPEPDKIIFHRNLDADDYRYCNLEIIPRSRYSEIMNAYRNLNSTLRIIPHDTDVYSYIVQWQELNKRCKKKFNDIVTARRFYMQKQLEYAKILNKYTRFD